jgi:hypothetical protein
MINAYYALLTCAAEMNTIHTGNAAIPGGSAEASKDAGVPGLARHTSVLHNMNC